MKKQIKIAGISALAVLGIASLAACGDKNNSTPLEVGGQLDVSLNYNVKKIGKTGLSYNGTAGTRTLSYANVTLKVGDMLPTWKCIQNNLNDSAKNSDYNVSSAITLNDANPYDQDDYKKDFTQHWVNGFTGKNSEKIDLVMGSGTYYTQFANDGKLVAISDYLDQMPNFKKWVDANPDIWSSMKHTDGKVYFTPYFDGLNSIEKMFLMNTEYVEKLLDGEIDSADEAKTLTATQYQPYVVETEKQTISVSVNGTAKNITVDYAEANNAVKKQNSLSSQNGKTLVAALKEALIAEYGEAIDSSIPGGKATGSNVVYTKLSQIFTGESACYNTDDLIALLRCVKTCPKTLTGDSNSVMNPISPRTAENKRTIDLVSLTSLWGVKGNDSENGKLYYDVNGELKDGRTTGATYDALDKLHQLYNEGLFVDNFTSDPKGTALGSTEWRSKTIKDGTGFLEYDYNGTTSPFNDDVAKDSKSSIQPVLAPVVKWQSDSSKTLNYKGTNLAGKYFRYSEANRALKDGGWCIPASSDNVNTALALMDYLFSDEGARIQDFGPDTGEYWTLKTAGASGNTDAENAICNINGGKSPIINQAILDDIQSNSEGVTWNDYYRAFIGSTQGIGHVREDSLDYQTTVSAKSKAGLSNVQNAIKSGAMILAQTSIDTKTTSKFFVSVPQTIAISSDQLSAINSSTQNDTLKSVWASDDKSIVCPAVNWIIKGEEAIKSNSYYASGRSGMEADWNTIDSIFLEAYTKGAKKIIK